LFYKKKTIFKEKKLTKFLEKLLYLIHNLKSGVVLNLYWQKNIFTINDLYVIKDKRYKYINNE